MLPSQNKTSAKIISARVISAPSAVGYKWIADHVAADSKNRTNPAPGAKVGRFLRLRPSRKINARLTGRTSRICVYSSVRHAVRRRPITDREQITKDTAINNAKMPSRLPNQSKLLRRVIIVLVRILPKNRNGATRSSSNYAVSTLKKSCGNTSKSEQSNFRGTIQTHRYTNRANSYVCVES